MMMLTRYHDSTSPASEKSSRSRALSRGTTNSPGNVFAPLVPDLLKASKCADFVVNKGHYFGTDYLPASEGEPGLSDADKHALIAFLKMF